MDNGQYDNRISGKLAPYEQKVITMRSKGITYKKIHEQIVKEGIDARQIKAGDEKIYASEIYGLICSCLVYKLRDKESFNVGKVYKEFENTVIKGLKEI